MPALQSAIFCFRVKTVELCSTRADEDICPYVVRGLQITARADRPSKPKFAEMPSCRPIPHFSKGDLCFSIGYGVGYLYQAFWF